MLRRATNEPSQEASGLAGHHLPMDNGTYEVRRATLDESDANRLSKWASLWADLLHADQALSERADLPDVLSNVFVRRALWEAAVVSYGRMATSDKRNVDYEELVQAARGDRGAELHKTLMVWRHDHVAHRKVPRSRDREDLRRLPRLRSRRARLHPGTSDVVGRPSHGLTLRRRVRRTCEGIAGHRLGELPRTHRRTDCKTWPPQFRSFGRSRKNSRAGNRADPVVANKRDQCHQWDAIDFMSGPMEFTDVPQGPRARGRKRLLIRVAVCGAP